MLELRKKLGYTQEGLANAMSKTTGMEITRSAIGNYERGIREPDLDTIIAFADYFHVSIPYIMGRKENDDIEQQKIKANLLSRRQSKEWRVLSEGFERMEKQEYDSFMAYFKMLTTTRPDLFNERNDDDDPES